MPQKILVIDDSTAIHRLIVSRLSDLHVEISCATDGDTGLRMASMLLPDLILLDVDMPDADGFDVCRRLKAEAATVAIPVVFLTGASTSSEKIIGLELGAVDYITKPFDSAELRARVRSALRTKYLIDLLNQRAMIDGLTAMWNRAYFDSRLASEIGLARRRGSPLSVILFDIDHFKSINDRFGHLMGDRVLCALSETMAGAIRAEDVICRFGGEEFAIICPGVDAGGASVLAERLRRMISEMKLTCRDQPVPVSASFGVAQWQEGIDLVANADAAMYGAKQGGRNRVKAA